MMNRVRDEGKGCHDGDGAGQTRRIVEYVKHEFVLRHVNKGYAANDGVKQNQDCQSKAL